MEEAILNLAIPVKTIIGAEEPAWKAWRLLKSSDTGILPVSHKQNLVGLVTNRDVLRFANTNGGQSLAVKEIMQPDPLLVNINKTVREAINLMLTQSREIAVIVDDHHNLFGVYSWTEAVRLILKHGNISL